MENLYNRLNKISNIICKILSILIVGIVIVNAGSVFLQVVNRYIIVKISDFSFPWTEELARYSMIWLCYLALPIVYREGSMAQLDLVFDRLGKNDIICNHPDSLSYGTCCGCLFWDLYCTDSNDV